MRETIFYIVVNIKTVNGLESVGQFFIGNNREIAAAIFRKLKGDENVDDKTVLSLELRETVNGLPVNMQMIGCTLEEMADNCKIITKETFKLLNLKEIM